MAYQVPPSMGLSRQEYQSRLPFPSPGDLPNGGIELRSPTLQADTLPSEPPFRYDLNPMPYDYSVEVMNRFKGLNLVDRVSEEVWTDVGNMYCTGGRD